MNIQELKLPLIKRTKIAEDTYEIRLGLKNISFDYLAGQYITLRLEEKIKDGKGPLRAFSLSSSPTNKAYLSTCFRVSNPPSIFKDRIMNMEIGTSLILRGPLGKFTLPDKNVKKIVLIAGGVGITPFFGMINYLTDIKSNQKVDLIYTNKNEKTRAYKKELENLGKKNKNLRIITENKRVNENFLKNYVDEKDTLFYICGTPQMVLDVTNFLTNLKVQKENIKFEKFSGY